MNAFTPSNAWRIIRPTLTLDFMLKVLLFLVGSVFTPLTLVAIYTGYRRAMTRFTKEELAVPLIGGRGISAIVAFAIGLFIVIEFTAAYLLYHLLVSENTRDRIWYFLADSVPIYWRTNAIATVLLLAVYAFFKRRRDRMELEQRRHGTSRLGTSKDVVEHLQPEGLFIGGDLALNDMGHILTVGATRSGKGTNLIIPALLDAKRYQGSWVIIDPKGENAAITADYQAAKGQHVLFLDPWGLRTDTPDTYNPLDFVRLGDELADDAMVIAEMIVPTDTAGPDRFWSDRARSLIAGLIMHIKESDLTLNDLFNILRLEETAFTTHALLLQANPNPVIAATGNEIISGLKNEKMFTSIMATALQHTDFLKSPALKYNMEKSSFSMTDLTEGKTSLYVIIPADKLHSHYQWLRLISTCSMMTAVRHHNKKVTFLLDEFANLGSLPNVAAGLAYMAGYNVSLWMILQSLPQLRNLYRDQWEDFIANTAVKQYVGIADNFTAEYVAHSIGGTTFVTTDSEGQGWEKRDRFNSSQRLVLTPDEVKATTDKNIILQISKAPTLIVPKKPYYNDETLLNRARTNPMHRAATAAQ